MFDQTHDFSEDAIGALFVEIFQPTTCLRKVNWERVQKSLRCSKDIQFDDILPCGYFNRLHCLSFAYRYISIFMKGEIEEILEGKRFNEVADIFFDKVFRSRRAVIDFCYYPSALKLATAQMAYMVLKMYEQPVDDLDNLIKLCFDNDKHAFWRDSEKHQWTLDVNGFVEMFPMKV